MKHKQVNEKVWGGGSLVSKIPSMRAAANQQVSAVPVYTTSNPPHPDTPGVGCDDDVEIILV